MTSAKQILLACATGALCCVYTQRKSEVHCEETACKVRYGKVFIFLGLIGLAAYGAKLQAKIEQPTVISFPAKITTELHIENETSLSSLAFNNTGEYLAVRSGKNTINVWQWKTKTIVATLNLPGDTNDFLSTAALTFSPDGSLLMSCHTPGSGYSSITLWETKTWKVARTIPTEKSGGGCTAAGFTSDGKHIVRLTQKSRTQPGNTIEVYSTDSWKLSHGTLQILRCHYRVTRLQWLDEWVKSIKSFRAR
jgi:WD40 repeat protein